MPIYDRTYRAFDGRLRRHFRWWVMVMQEWRIIRKSRLFWVLTVPSIFYTLFLVIYIYTLDLIGTNSQNPLSEMVSELPIATVDNNTFFNYIRIQGPFVFLILIFSGAGLIANDFRYHLVDVYFSKPLSWLDYVLGKSMTLIVIGLCLTFVPACLLMLMHLAFVPTWQTLKDTWWLPIPTLLFSLVVILPSTLAVLASSSFFNSQRFAGIAVFMVLLVNSILGRVLSELLREDQLSVLAFPVAVYRLGEEVFKQPNITFDVSWQWSLAFVAGVCSVCLYIVCRKVRRAGAAA